MPTYCLDSDVYVQAHRNYYAHDIVPGFWTALERWSKAGQIVSPSAVFDELSGQADWLADWLVERRKTLFRPPDAKVFEVFRAVSDFVWRRYEVPEAEEFLSVADPFVVAYAATHNLTVVTMEVRKDEHKRRDSEKIAGKIKLPNVCEHFDVPYINTYQLIRNLKSKFVFQAGDTK